MKFGWKEDGKRVCIVCLAALMMALNIKTFVQTGGLYPGGATGLSLFHIPGKLCLIDLQPIPGLRWELIDHHICHGLLSLSYTALHFKTNQIIHFYGIFQRKLF